MKQLAPLIALALAACTTAAEKDAAAREAAYRQCLKDSMAVAMAWEAIEAMCRNRAGTEDALSAAPKS